MFRSKCLFFFIFATTLAFASSHIALAQSTNISPIPATDRAAGFNPNTILEDADILSVEGASLDRLNRFLRSKPGSLATYRAADIDGVTKSAAEILWRVATSYHINPMYLLALLQKEQSLVEHISPTQKQYDWAAGYGICDACSMDDPSLQTFRGFASQVEWAAKQHREKYLLQILGRGATISGIAPGKPTVIDGISITPTNQATAMLYSYTPHIAGNLTLWRIWQRWFRRPLPDGTFAQATKSKKIYLLRLGSKRPIASRAVAASLVDPNKIISVDDDTLAVYPEGPPIAFANYALIEMKNGTRFLLAGNRKRHIVDAATFRKFGFNEDEVITAEEDDIAGYADGPDLTVSTTYPTGLLARDEKGSYWYVEDGRRSLIPSPAFLSLYFKGRTAKRLPAPVWQSLEIGDSYRLRDGELVRSAASPSVSVIEHGARRPIMSSAVFESLGWKWKNVVTLPEDVMKDYPLGESITL